MAPIAETSDDERREDPEAGVRMALLLAVTWVAALVVRMMRQPLFLDEVDFVVATRHWPAQLGIIPHPPGYAHVLHALFSAFGESTTVARIPGLVGAFVTIALIPALCAELVRDRSRAAVATKVAAALFAANALTPQNAVLVDIDNTLAMPILVGLFLFGRRVVRDPAPSRVVSLAVAIGVALWLKLPPPAMMCAALVGASVWSGEFRAALRLASAAAIGGVLAVFGFAVAGPQGYSFWHVTDLASHLGESSGWHTILVRAPQTAGIALLWFGLPAAALAVMGGRFACRERGEARGSARAAWVFLGVTAMFYTLLLPPAWGYPKYHVVALPFLAALAGAWWATSELVPRPRAFVFAAAVAFAAQWMLGDTLRSVYRVSFTSGLGDLAARLAATRDALLRSAVPTAAAGTVMLFTGRNRIELRGLCGNALLAGAIGGGAALAVLQSEAEYSTRYLYSADPRQLLAAAHDVQSHSLPGDRALAPKDVLFHAGRAGRYSTDLVHEGAPAESLVAAIHTGGFAALVWTTKEEARCGVLLHDRRVDSSLTVGWERRVHGDWIVWTPRRELVVRAWTPAEATTNMRGP